MIDKRLIKVGIAIDNKLTWYDDLYIDMKGVKVTESIASQFEIVILNLTATTRERILRLTRPFSNETSKVQVTVEVGRESTGTSVMYQGDVFRSFPTEKPDLGIRLMCLTNFFNKNTIVSFSSEVEKPLSEIAQEVADANDLGLVFEIEDKPISRFSFAGSSQAAIEQLQELAVSDVYVNNGTLYVKDSDKPLTRGGIPFVSVKSGGLMKAGGTDYGCEITMLYDPAIDVGRALELESVINPSLNGRYTVIKMPLHLTNRDVPFYIYPECVRIS